MGHTGYLGRVWLGGISMEFLAGWRAGWVAGAWRCFFAFCVFGLGVCMAVWRAGSLYVCIYHHGIGRWCACRFFFLHLARAVVLGEGDDGI